MILAGSPEVRPATTADLPAIAEVYNHYVLHSIATFDLEPRPPDHFSDHLLSRTPGHHVLVATDSGELVGFAYSGAYRVRPAYAGTCETSVYLAPGETGRGLGRTVYEELLRRVDADGIHACLAVIAQPNPASESLHSSLGFTRSGVLEQVGRKFDRWVDTALWQRVGDLRPGGAPP